jgi:hypothetical protein
VVPVRIVLALALVALAAGCAGSAESVHKTSSAAASPEATSAAANATATNVTIRMPPPVMLDYQGSSAQGACTFGTPADQCQFTSSGTETFHKVDYKGRAARIAVQVTYPAQQPGFAMYAAVCVGKPGAQITVNDCKDYKTAPSPMILEADLRSAPEGAPVGLSVGSVAVTPTPAGALVFAQSDFKVKGALTLTG